MPSGKPDLNIRPYHKIKINPDFNGYNTSSAFFDNKAKRLDWGMFY